MKRTPTYLRLICQACEFETTETVWLPQKVNSFKRRLKAISRCPCGGEYLIAYPELEIIAIPKPENAEAQI